MKKTLLLLQFFFLIFSYESPAVAGTAHAGITKKEITANLFRTIAYGMPMQEIERLLGGRGRLVNKEEGVDTYQWKAPKSSITISFEKRRVVDAIGVSRRGRYFSMEAPKEVFDEGLLKKLKTKTTYDSVVALIGWPAMTVKEAAGTTRTETCHWVGGNGSSLIVTFTGGKIVDASIASPIGNLSSLKKTGEVAAVTK